MNVAFLIVRVTCRHGSPANLPKGQSPDKIEFANFYLKGYSGMNKPSFLY